MLISLAIGSKETLTVWVNPKTVKMQREISSPVKSNLRSSREFLQKGNQDSKKPLRAKSCDMSDFSGHM
jgi:hypothetical protein